jgi:hypothetical protein
MPPVFATEAFALKGGTAINLFMAPVARLSRDEELATIGSELDGIRERATSIGLGVRAPRRLTGDDTQLLVSDGQIEVNQIFRGSVLPPRMVDLHPTAQNMFATDVTARFGSLAGTSRG